MVFADLISAADRKKEMLPEIYPAQNHELIGALWYQLWTIKSKLQLLASLCYFVIL